MIRSRLLAAAGRSVAPSGAEGLAERAALVNALASVPAAARRLVRRRTSA
jgi:hypothetical protein